MIVFIFVRHQLFLMCLKMSDEDYILKQIEVIFEKIVSLPEESVKKVIRKIIDILTALKKLYPSAVPSKNISDENSDLNVKDSREIPQCNKHTHQLIEVHSCESSEPIQFSQPVSVNKLLQSTAIKAAAVSKKGGVHRLRPRRFACKIKPNLFCDVCNYSTSNKLDLKKHVHKHIVKTKHTCTICEKSFSISTCLKLHLKRHANQRDFPCDICEYKAFTKLEKKRHMAKHSGERNQVCHYCGKTYTQESTLKEHVSTIHECSIKLQCPQCDFTTHHPKSLKTHIKIRHEGELNNFICPVCGRNVKVRKAFLEHMRSHTGERPFRLLWWIKMQI